MGMLISMNFCRISEYNKKGSANQKRQAVIDQAFKKFDKEKAGFIKSSDLKFY